MLKSRRHGGSVVLVLVGMVLCSSAVQAQTRPWNQYFDVVSQTTCGLIHGANGEFVVLRSTGEMVIVSGPDVILQDVLVDEAGNVFFGNDPAGFIDFDTDADGDRALFWLTLTGRLVEIGAFDASPGESLLRPVDLRNTGCDACAQWDNSAVCADEPNPDEETSNPLAGLCGSGVTGGALATFTLMFTGKARRRRARRNSRK